MPGKLYGLPELVHEEIIRHSGDVRSFAAGEIAPDLFKSLRVPRGIYEQRADGKYMLRVRIAGGAMTARQVRTIAEAALRNGSDILHVTTRQDLQLHNLDIGATPAVMQELEKAGLASVGGGGNTVRNISACPYSGVCPQELFDTTPFAAALTQSMMASKSSFNLPRKYKIAFSGCRADCAMAGFADLGFIARIKDGKPCFKLYSGGGMGADSRIADVICDALPLEDVFRAAEAVRRIFDKFGDRKNRNRARLRFVFEKLGLEHMKKLFSEGMDALAAEGWPICSVTPEFNTGREEGGTAVPPLETIHGLKALRQRQEGLCSILLQLKFGDISPEGLSFVAETAEKFSRSGIIRTTQSQNLMLNSVEEKEIPGLAEHIKARRPELTHYGAFRHLRACTGANTCRLGLCLSQNLAEAIAAEIAGSSGVDTDDPIFPDIRVNGCPNACGQHPAASVGLAGLALRNGDRLYPAYRLFLGGRTGDGISRLSSSVANIPAKKIPALLSKLLADYFKRRKGKGECFNDYLDRMGMDYFKEMAAAYAKVPDLKGNPGAYSDWGTDRPFSIEGRRPGECSSGIFSMVASDISSARKYLEEGKSDGSRRDDLFCKALLAGVRALLITRGVYSGNPGECVDAFEKHFMETGLVDRKYLGPLSVLKGCCSGSCCCFRCPDADVEEFIARIEYLHSTLDAGLNFHPEKK